MDLQLQPSVFHEYAHVFSRCRFCAEPKNLLNLSTNHDVMKECVNMMEVLKIDFIDFSSITLPKALCEACYQALAACYHFITKAKLSQSVLSEFYGCDTATDSKKGIKSESIDQYSNDEKRDCASVCDTPLLKISLLRSQTRDASKNIPFTLTNPELSNTSITKNEEVSAQIAAKNLQTLINSKPVSRNKGRRNISVESSNYNISSASKISISNFQTFTHSKSGKSNVSIKGSQQEHDHTYSSSLDYKHEPRVGTPSSVSVSSVNSDESHEPYQSVYFKSETSCSATDTASYKIDIKSPTPEIKENVLAPDCSVVPIVNLDAAGDLKGQNESWTNYPWACKHCNVKFDTMDDVREHSKQLHRICYGFQCVDCSQLFVAFNSFVEHVRQHRVNLRMYCQYCNERFESRPECEQHALSHWDAGVRICDLCGERCAGALELATHRKMYKPSVLPKKEQKKTPKRVLPYTRHSGAERRLVIKWEDYEWTCQDCGIRTPDIVSLRAHARELHDRCFAMKCVDCLVVFRNFPAFVSHVSAHRPNLKSYCPYCGCDFEDLTLRKKHLLDHKTNQNTCDCCGEIFEDKATVLHHLKRYVRKRLKGTVTVDDKTCQICSKVFKNRFIMKLHQETHDENRKRDHVCDTCGKAFYTSHLLDNHIVTHSERTVVCKMCEQAFPSAYHLKRHVASHISYKPLTCDICGKSYRRKRELAMHLQCHSDEKRYKCSVCEKKFRLQSYLKSHMIIHTGMRPFLCEHCEKTFTYWPNCDKHMRRMHGVALAKNKLTPQGKFPINRKTGIPMTVTSDQTTEAWMREVVKPKRSVKKPIKQKVIQQISEDPVSSDNVADSSSLLVERLVQSSNWGTDE